MCSRSPAGPWPSSGVCRTTSSWPCRTPSRISPRRSSTSARVGSRRTWRSSCYRDRHSVPSRVVVPEPAPADDLGRALPPPAIAAAAGARGHRRRRLRGPGLVGARFYHSGDTGDLELVVRRLLEREPDVHLVAAGVSIGGNVLLKWLGEHGKDAPRQLIGAAAISTPYDLTSCARALDRGFARMVYTANFLRSLKAKVRDKARVYPDFVDVQAVLRARTFAEYDRALTAPL